MRGSEETEITRAIRTLRRQVLITKARKHEKRQTKGGVSGNTAVIESACCGPRSVRWAWRSSAWVDGIDAWLKAKPGSSAFVVKLELAALEKTMLKSLARTADLVGCMRVGEVRTDERGRFLPRSRKSVKVTRATRLLRIRVLITKARKYVKRQTKQVFTAKTKDREGYEDDYEAV